MVVNGHFYVIFPVVHELPTGSTILGTATAQPVTLVPNTMMKSIKSSKTSKRSFQIQNDSNEDYKDLVVQELKRSKLECSKLLLEKSKLVLEKKKISLEIQLLNMQKSKLLKKKP